MPSTIPTGVPAFTNPTIASVQGAFTAARTDINGLETRVGTLETSGGGGGGGPAVALYGAYVPNATTPAGPHTNGTLFVNTAAMTNAGASLYIWDVAAWTPIL